MNTRSRTASLTCLLLLAPLSAKAAAAFVDRSAQLTTDRFTFASPSPAEARTNNENYYDGDFGDFDHDGYPDRILGSRYGLLFNTGDGYMIPYNGHTNFLLRGMPGASGWGEDGFNWADVDGDGDLDALSGGNNETFACQENSDGYFTVKFAKASGASALNIVNTDLEGDGDVDLAVAHAFCWNTSCGGPVQFTLWVNDGTGNMTEAAAARGLPYTNNSTNITGVVSGDVDRDGDQDLVLKNGTASAFVLARNDGTGHFSLELFDLNTAASGYGSGFGQAMQLGDLDDDGDLDLLSGSVNPHGDHPDVAHALFINDGAGHFVEQSAGRFDVGTFDPALYFAQGVVGGENAKLFDVDYDGDLDIVAFTHTDGVMSVFLNDGAGVFTFSLANMLTFPVPATALGGDLDITDLDNDGSYDLWAGSGGGVVRELFNTYAAADGLPADVPRGFVVAAQASGVTTTVSLPSFAATARHFRVYRSSAPGLALKDRVLVATVGARHQDEAFSAPITRHTTSGELGDVRATVDAAARTVSFRDDGGVPGALYFYSVTHIGAENDESASTAELAATRPAIGPDSEGPVLSIVSPTPQTWTTQPRIVMHLADASGIDPASIVVSFDKALGASRPAGANLVDRATRSGPVVVIPITDGLALPGSTLVTLTVTAADLAGHATTSSVQFFTHAASAQPPVASFAISATSGDAPLTVQLDASASTDSGGRMLAWEWYFGADGTGFGRKATHTFQGAGTYDVVLAARDNLGGVSTSKVTVTVTGGAPACVEGASRVCYSGPAGTQDVGVCRGGSQVCVSGVWSVCGSRGPSTELCSDGSDNDCDGATDVSDPDCAVNAGGTGGPDVPGDDPQADGDAPGSGEGTALTGGCAGAPPQLLSVALVAWLLAIGRARRRVGRA